MSIDVREVMWEPVQFREALLCVPYQVVRVRDWRWLWLRKREKQIMLWDVTLESA